MISEKNINRICSFWLLCAIAILSYFIIKDAALILGDDRQFLPFLKEGKLIYGWFGSHRFWPLGLADYNILSLFPRFRNPTGLYIYNVIILVAFVGVMFKVLIETISTAKNYLAPTIAISSVLFRADFIEIYINIIYAERIIILAFAIFMLSFVLGYRKQAVGYYFIAFISAVCITYSKETMFCGIAVIACTNLLFDKKKLSTKDRLFFGSLLLQSVIYIIAYFWVTHNDVDSYNRLVTYPSVFESIRFCFRNNLYLFIFFGMAFFRSYMILFQNDRRYIFWDSCLFAGCTYTVAYFVLKLYLSYYFIPGVILGLPIICIYLNNILSNSTMFWKVFSVLLILCPTLQGLLGLPNYINSSFKNRRETTPEMVSLMKKYNEKKFYSVCDRKDNYLFKVNESFYQVWQEFSKYYNGKCKAEVIDRNDIYNISRDSIVCVGVAAYKRELSQKVSEFLLAENMFLEKLLFASNLYRAKELDTITDDCYLTENMYNYFGLIGIHKTLLTKSCNPIICMKLATQYRYKIYIKLDIYSAEKWTIKVNDNIIFSGNTKPGPMNLAYEFKKGETKAIVRFIPDIADDRARIKSQDDLYHNMGLKDFYIKRIRD